VNAETQGYSFGLTSEQFFYALNATIIDALLTAMVQTSDGVSDLFFVAGLPPGSLQSEPYY